MKTILTFANRACWGVIISISFFFSLFFAHLLCFTSLLIIIICSIQIHRDPHFSRFIGIQITQIQYQEPRNVFKPRLVFRPITILNIENDLFFHRRTSQLLDLISSIILRSSSFQSHSRAERQYNLYEKSELTYLHLSRNESNLYRQETPFHKFLSNYHATYQFCLI